MTRAPLAFFLVLRGSYPMMSLNVDGDHRKEDGLGHGFAVNYGGLCDGKYAFGWDESLWSHWFCNLRTFMLPKLYMKMLYCASAWQGQHIRAGKAQSHESQHQKRQSRRSLSSSSLSAWRLMPVFHPTKQEIVDQSTSIQRSNPLHVCSAGVEDFLPF